MLVPNYSVMAPRQFTRLFIVYDVVLGYTMPLIYALTMERQEETYRYIVSQKMTNSSIDVSFLSHLTHWN